MTQNDQLVLDDRWVTAIRSFADDEADVEEGWAAVMARSEGGDAYAYAVPSHPHPRRRKVVAAAAAGVVLTAALAAAVWAAADERTEVASEDSRSAVSDSRSKGRNGQYPSQGVIETDIPLDAPIVSRVARVLPAGSRIVWAVRSRDMTKPDGVNAIKLSAVIDRVGYEVTVYRRFATAELDGEIPRSETEWGTVWVGATDEDLTSIYFLSPTGVGLRVAYLNSPGEATATVEHLTSIAVVLATDPVIAEEATA